MIPYGILGIRVSASEDKCLPFQSFYFGGRTPELERYFILGILCVCVYVCVEVLEGEEG
jgi:hypothetical protein